MLDSTFEVKQQYILREEKRRSDLLMLCFNVQDGHAPQVLQALDRSRQISPLHEASSIIDDARQVWRVCSVERNSPLTSVSILHATPIVERQFL